MRQSLHQEQKVDTQVTFDLPDWRKPRVPVFKRIKTTIASIERKENVLSNERRGILKNSIDIQSPPIR